MQLQKELKQSSITSFFCVIFFTSLFTLCLLDISILDIDKVHASSSRLSNENAANGKNIKDKEKNDLEINNNPFYESESGKIIGQSVQSVSNNSPQIKQTIMEDGIIKNIGNVTNVQTWVNTFKSPGIFFGTGKGVMTAEDGQIATWKGYDIGISNNKSTITYHGITFFDTNSTGKMSFLKNLIGLHMTKVVGNKQFTKIWEWDP